MKKISVDNRLGSSIWCAKFYEGTVAPECLFKKHKLNSVFKCYRYFFTRSCDAEIVCPYKQKIYFTYNLWIFNEFSQ